MRFRVTFAFCFVAILSAWGVLRAQRPFKEYPAIEYNNFPKPPDWEQKTEWVRARLRYPDIYGYPDHVRFGQKHLARNLVALLIIALGEVIDLDGDVTAVIRVV